MLVEKAIQAEALKCFCSYSAGTSFGYAVQDISKTWAALAETANLTPIANQLSVFNLLDFERKQFFLSSKWEQGFASREQSHHRLQRKDPVNNKADVENGE